MDPLLGQVGLITHPNDWFGRVTDWVTLSDVYHTVVYLGDNRVLHVAPPFAVIRDADDWENIIWSHFPLTAKQAQDCADWAAAREGRPYNMTADACIAFHYLTGVQLPLFILKRFSNDRSYECAQLADAALTLGAGITVFDDGRLFGMVCPGDFEQLYKLYGWWPADFVPTPRIPGVRGLARCIWPEPTRIEKLAMSYRARRTA